MANSKSFSEKFAPLFINKVFQIWNTSVSLDPVQIYLECTNWITDRLIPDYYSIADKKSSFIDFLNKVANSQYHKNNYERMRLACILAMLLDKDNICEYFDSNLYKISLSSHSLWDESMAKYAINLALDYTDEDYREDMYENIHSFYNKIHWEVQNNIQEMPLKQESAKDIWFRLNSESQ